MSRAFTLVLASLLLTGSATGALAQGTRSGDTQFPGPIDGSTKRFSSVAYDKANDAYLVAWGVINLGARFVSATGTPLGSDVALNTDGSGRQAGAVRVACGAEINACLVTWIEESPTRVVGRLLRYNAGSVQFLSERLVLNANGSPKHTESAPSVAYSSAAQEFLVAWAEYPGPDVKAQRISGSGTPVGNEIVIANSGDWEGLPSATYNSATNEYMVAYYYEPGLDAIGATRVKPGTGDVLGNMTLYSGPFEKYPEIAYNSVNNEYFVISWSAGFTVHGRRFDASGAPLAAVDTLAAGGGDGIGLGYNPVSNSYLAVYLSGVSDEIWGSIISSGGAAGVPFMVTSSGTTLATQPQAAGSTVSARFLTVASEKFRRVMSQLVANGDAPPPPPPPPPPPSCTFTIGSTAVTLPPAPMSGTVALTASASTCDWTASVASSASWISLQSSASGKGSATITFNVARNLLQPPRTGTITIAGRTFTVNQRGQKRQALDFNLDEKVDLLVHHRTEGWVGKWNMNGTSSLGGDLLIPNRVPDTRWTVVGTADFTGDGWSDMLWQHADGSLAVWTMSGVFMQSVDYTSPQRLPTNWRARSIADINGDGKPDIIIQNLMSGEAGVWLMDGLTAIDGHLFNPGVVPDIRWKIVGTDDFNGDGEVDLLWQHDNNGVAVWYMNGLNRTSVEWLSPAELPTADWKVVSVGDLNSDGKPDIVFQNQATNGLMAWIMSGHARADAVTLNPSSILPNWSIVGPR